MGKKGKKNSAQTEPSIPHKDVYHRMNFLHQASIYLATIPAEPRARTLRRVKRSVSESKRDFVESNEVRLGIGSSEHIDQGIMLGMDDGGRRFSAGSEGQKKEPEQLQRPQNQDKVRVKKLRGVPYASLARFYASTMKTVGQKLVLRQDPKVKHSMCSVCRLPLLPGITSNVAISNSRRLKDQQGITQVCRGCGSARVELLDMRRRDVADLSRQRRELESHWEDLKS